MPSAHISKEADYILALYRVFTVARIPLASSTGLLCFALSLVCVVFPAPCAVFSNSIHLFMKMDLVISGSFYWDLDRLCLLAFFPPFVAFLVSKKRLQNWRRHGGLK